MNARQEPACVSVMRAGLVALPMVRELRRRHSQRLMGSADSRFKLLGDWFGGPPPSIQERRSPQLRMRHLPDAIGAIERDERSRCVRQALASVIAALALALPMTADAEPVAAGSAMPALSLNDQYDKPVLVGPQTRWVVLAAEKPVSDMVSAVLAAEPVGALDRLRLVYVADISGMPALVTRLFALPKLRELPFPIALVREPAQVTQVAEIPRTSGGATVLRLEGGRVMQVATARQAADLRALLSLPASPAAP